jgi:hypothetical protein
MLLFHAVISTFRIDSLNPKAYWNVRTMFIEESCGSSRGIGVKLVVQSRHMPRIDYRYKWRIRVHIL